MKMNKAAQILSTVAITSAMSITPAYAEEVSASTGYESLDDSFDEYFEEAAFAGGEDNLSDSEIQRLIIQSLR